MTPDRERIEREARNLVRDYSEDTFPSRGELQDAIVSLVLRERAAALEMAARACRDALEDERKVLNAGAYIEACMELENRVCALAAQERAQ